jgi:predicted aconitase with swiveling domain
VELLFHYAAGTATLTMTDSLGNSMVATMTLTSTDNLEFEGTLTLTPAGEGATVQNYQVWGWVGTNGAGTQSLFIAGEDPIVTGEGIVFEFPLTPNQDTTL